MTVKTKTWTVLLAVMLAVVVAAAVTGMILTRHQPVILQGSVECPQITISGKLTGRIERLVVSEGDSVRAGDTLVVISCPEAYAKLRQVSGLEQAANSQRDKIDDGTRRQIVESARQLWNKAQAELDLASATWQRVEALWRDSIATSQRRDEAHTLLMAAQANENAARQQYLLARSGAQRQDRQSARSLVEAARGAVDEVEALLHDIHLTSPADGCVSDVYPRVGELVGAGAPVMSVVVLSDAYVVLNVREDLLPHFGVGCEFRGDVPALAAEDVRFRIYYVSPLGSYATWRSTRQTGSYDLRTFEIKARPVAPLHGLRPGMSVLTQQPHNQH